MKNTADFLRTNDNFLILTHARPDGDTTGCAGALCAGLRAIGKNAFVARNPDFTAKYAPYISPYLAPEGYVHETAVAVDIANRTLLPKPFRDLPVDLRVDHHPCGEAFAGRELVMPEKAACGEVVAMLLDELGVPLTKDIALRIYLAISTDTGCFRYRNTTADTMRLAARCLDAGMDKTPVIETFFSIKTRSRLGIEAQMLSSIEYYDEGRLAVAVLTKEMIASSGADEDDLENLSAIPKQVFGVMAGVLIREDNDGCRLSVRTSPPYRANNICAAFGGGGHDQAGGAHTGLSAGDAKAELLRVWGRQPENA